MTDIQVKYWSNQENIRHNMETEAIARAQMLIDERKASASEQSARAAQHRAINESALLDYNRRLIEAETNRNIEEIRRMREMLPYEKIQKAGGVVTGLFGHLIKGLEVFN